MMQLGFSAALIALVIEARADGPSEQFREAMTACTLPGPGISPRIDQLTTLGWRPAIDHSAVASLHADALLLFNPPTSGDPAEWTDRRAWALNLVRSAAPHEGFFAKGTSVIQVQPQRETGHPTCLLFAARSRDSDFVLHELDRAGGLVSGTYIERGTMFTIRIDTGDRRWRTEIALVAATDALSPLLGTPPATTLAITLVTRPER
jgi:hypothetical protein